MYVLFQIETLFLGYFIRFRICVLVVFDFWVKVEVKLPSTWCFILVSLFSMKNYVKDCETEKVRSVFLMGRQRTFLCGLIFLMKVSFALLNFLLSMFLSCNFLCLYWILNQHNYSTLGSTPFYKARSSPHISLKHLSRMLSNERGDPIHGTFISW